MVLERDVVVIDGGCSDCALPSRRVKCGMHVTGKFNDTLAGSPGLVVDKVMFFPFTFTMSVPGIMNPFAKSPYLLSGATDSRNIANGLQGKRLLSLADRRPHPSSLPPPVPLARKRGWQPSSPEPSPATTVTTSTTGHLNVHPASSNLTISHEARGEGQRSEMAPGRYFCIADCTYLRGWKSRASYTHIIHAPLSLRHKIRQECTWLYAMLFFAHGRHE